MAIKVLILAAYVFAILSTGTIKANHSENLLQFLNGDSLPREKPPDSIPIIKKICSCKLVEVRSDTYDRQLVGIFAEKTVTGKYSDNIKALRHYIEREKSIFKYYFLETLKKKKVYSNKGNCQELFKELKLKHRNLVLYNIIDVDALAKK